MKIKQVYGNIDTMAKRKPIKPIIKSIPVPKGKGKSVPMPKIKSMPPKSGKMMPKRVPGEMPMVDPFKKRKKTKFQLI